MNPMTRSALAAMALAISAASLQAQAQSTVTEQPDGTVAVTVEERQIVVPAQVADEIVVAVGEHSEDPQALEQAVREIVAEHAGSAGDADLATAIAALAIFHAGVRSSTTDAIMRGAIAANPVVPAAVLLAELPTLPTTPRTEDTAQRQLAVLQATVENPSQVSPVQ